MTSRNSFWARSVENHKRRIWVWIVAFLIQLVAYVGLVTIYISRIRYYEAEGVYRTAQAYAEALAQAVQDALGFSPKLFLAVGLLAAVIGKQGFSYLNDRRKVDMYHSVPVSKKRRFLVIYTNGVVIYLTSTLVSLIIGILVAAAQGVVTGQVIAVVGIAFLWNLLFFMVVYHMMILAEMLTGNSFVCLCVFALLAFYEQVLYSCLRSFRYSFFTRASNNYVLFVPKLSVTSDYYDHVDIIKYMDTPQEMARTVFPYLGKWFLIALVLFVCAYVCYNKRMSEAAGKAIAFSGIKPVLKVLVVVLAAMIVGGIVRDSTYENDMLMLAAMLACAFIVSAVMEIVYEFDLRCMLRHWGSSIIAVACTALVFCVFKFDLAGYDSYIPEADEVESVLFQPNTDYENYWDENFDYISNEDHLMENMHITAIEEVIALADKDQKEDYETMIDPRWVQVVYHLKSGRDVERAFYVDFENPGNEELLNRIVGSDEYKNSMYQITWDEASYDSVQSVTYTNGCVTSTLPLEDAQELREAYLKDLEQMDFSLVHNKLACGQLQFGFSNYKGASYPVYDSYTNVLAYLKEQGAYYPVTLEAEDIAAVTVTNYHNELLYEEEDSEGAYDHYREAVATQDAYYEDYYEDVTVQESFEDKEDIARIVEHIYPVTLPTDWNRRETFDSNYFVAVELEKDSDYPYDRTEYYFNYNMIAGEVPAFVAEATALK